MNTFRIKRKEHSLAKTIISALVLVIILAAFTLVVNNISATSHKEQQNILENALNRSITQCYALEGAYPPNVEYLCENYGLTYSKDTYYIDYQFIGSNLRPDVTVIKRSKS